MEKKFYYLLIACCMNLFSFSQNVAINSTGNSPDASAMLDVQSTNKGFLIPRMTSAFRQAISNPATGLLIFQTNNPVGLYTNIGSASTPNWVQLSTSINSWGVTGNGGTDPLNNFLGTTDNRPLSFRLNNIPAGQWDQINNNYFIGQNSGSANTASFNIGIGSFALQNNVANTNIAIGHGALQNNSNPLALGNIAIGISTLTNNTGGANIAIGPVALGANTSGSNNVAVGYNSLFSNTTGVSNVAAGTNSLFQNIDGQSNTAFGFGSLYANTNGSFNTAAGESSLYSNTAGLRNTAQGAFSLYSNSGGNLNSALGSYALFSNTNGNNATAVGYGAMQYTNNSSTPFTNTSVALGFEALRGSTTPANNTGIDNTATGYQSLLNNTSGDLNTANGYQSLSSNTGGGYNTANGGLALYHNISGSGNTADGTKALISNLDGNFNTANGSLALSSNISGSKNTALGYHADVSSGNLSNAAAIGAFAQVSINNAIVLGSINGVNGATENTKVGIGITSPAAPLHIKANSGSGNPQLLLEEDNSGDGSRITFKNSVLTTKYWDVWGYTNNSNASALLNFYYNGVGNVLSLQGDGNATLLGTLTQLSDKRLKTNIRPLNNTLLPLLSLNAYSYNWKDKQMDQSGQIGLLAQEVEKYFPELVKENEKGFKSVNYSGLLPVLVEAIKEQQKMISELQEKVERLEKRN
jgi:hypothetical protein